VQGAQRFYSPRTARVQATFLVIWWGALAGLALGITLGLIAYVIRPQDDELQMTVLLIGGALGLMAVVIPLLPKAVRVSIAWTETEIVVNNLGGTRTIPWSRVVGLDHAAIYDFPRSQPVVAIQTDPRNIWEHVPIHASLRMGDIWQSEIAISLRAELEARQIKSPWGQRTGGHAPRTTES